MGICEHAERHSLHANHISMRLFCKKVTLPTPDVHTIASLSPEVLPTPVHSIASLLPEVLRRSGFCASQLCDNGFTVTEMLEAGYSRKELDCYPPSVLRAASLKRRGSSASDVLSAGFSVSDAARAGYLTTEILDPWHKYLEV